MIKYLNLDELAEELQDDFYYIINENLTGFLRRGGTTIKNRNGQEVNVTIDSLDKEKNIIFKYEIQEQEQEQNTYLKLYSEDFDFEVWEKYCSVLGISFESSEVSLRIADFKVIR